MTLDQIVAIAGGVLGTAGAVFVAMRRSLGSIETNLGVNNPKTPDVGSTVNLIASSVTRIERGVTENDVSIRSLVKETGDIKNSLVAHDARLTKVEETTASLVRKITETQVADSQRKENG